MGNQLVGIAPSQIFPVEHYLTDHSNLKFDVNLGSTRFFKVARAKSQEGLVVVKVFVIHDPSLPLTTYRNGIEDIRTKLASAVNCLPFQKTILQDRAGFIIREYVKSSLYDKISTRPFLTNIQKKFMAFQILYALHQCHKVGVCHGDIKLENLMVTSWNWILLTDFASYKPSYLPEDNPADYSYFFDTSRRRTCYIAPERFNNKLSKGSTLFDEGLVKGELTPAMDIFSAGCALIELYNEGQPPFTLSQLLSYRINEYDPKRHLEKIEDIGIRNLLAHMIQKDPSARSSAEIYLDQARGTVFPEYFYSFLQGYMLMFSAAQPIMSPDEKIARLKSDINNVIEMLTKEKEPNNENSLKEGSDGLVIITTLVTSCIRALHHSNSKLQALEVLLELASHSSTENILDRIVPYIFHLMQDPVPRVRILSIHTLTKVLALVKNVPCSDANIFPEYVLPGLAPLTNDPVILVRSAYAQNIADLAQIALSYIENSRDCQSSKPSDTPKLSYETELRILRDMIQQTVSSLLADSENIVKITLAEYGITRLCVFFGKQKANDVLLSHLITFLNDKNDKQLRGSFFDCLVGVVSYVGVYSSAIITPLLQQGLSDPEEFIIVKSINAMKELTKLNLLCKASVYQLLQDTACFLVHPNLWIRHAVAGFIVSIAVALDTVDVQCKVVNHLSNYFKSPVIQVNKEYLILNALLDPVPREVFDTVLKCQDIEILLHTLQERQKARNLVKAGHVPQYISIPSIFRRLISEGMNDLVEDQLISMGKHLLKMHKHKMFFNDDKQINLSETNGKLDLSLLNVTINSHCVNLKTDVQKEFQDANKKRMDKCNRLSPELHSNIGMNSEWQHMFGTGDMAATQISKTTITSSNLEVPSSPLYSLISDTDQSLHEKSYIQYRCAPCKSELRKLISRKQEMYFKTSRARELAEQTAWGPHIPPPGWRLKGTLVAHLHEHRSSVNKLVPLPGKGKFVSCSNDGCIRLWDCIKMEGKNIANRSKLLYNRQTGALMGLTLCENHESLASASANGSVFVMRVETSSNKVSLLHSRQLDIQEDGCAVDINYLDSGSQSVLVYATMYGSLVGWDLRKPGTAWKLDNDLKHGVITSFCLDSQQCWAAVATSSGYHTAWDLRFQLAVANCVHPAGRVRKVVRHPTEKSWILSAVQGNNEISMWNMETQTRQGVLWGTTTPPLSKSSVNGHSVCAMYAGEMDRSPFVFTGGTDMRLRYWDLSNSTNSYLAVPSALDVVNSSSFSYE
ncbi:Phosphoinositide 3-kinase regulatory subunit, putative [Pediculus humanus corporis]|uniref:non-specific serine/threonine protein kinase n=1 Tax=Pediculus humanus subsp. corporis TaxID=121224 RepID=E0VUY6_PEDHC|nr:Phosphoinositide 3-kinase regulatory subunit, putative [Pediculus humanus corporis]EEB17192.1 Phosphoinositide 3-kinase regulatory subunit, putative [Pediculus humanus corporis]